MIDAITRRKEGDICTNLAFVPPRSSRQHREIIKRRIFLDSDINYVAVTACLRCSGRLSPIQMQTESLKTLRW